MMHGQTPIKFRIFRLMLVLLYK